uniref:Uncharacterized protein LOC100187240 n=1 Tax=Phallusia mammillata TaxID=59560 RepID=A0A6F9DJ94_9ASCI|nr:uncharacterized protein LOC100187240 [Phallusia mammillata]
MCIPQNYGCTVFQIGHTKMKVIVASHQKTGTKTLHQALEILGYSVYDFLENFCLLGNEWEKILHGNATTADFQQMYKNVDAVCDQPCLVYWEEIHKAFPDAKIILSVRDEEAWFKSLVGQVEANDSNYLLWAIFLLAPSAWKMMRLGTTVARLSLGLQGSMFKPHVNEMYAKLSYRRHNAHVIQNAPKDKLLVYNIKDGWEPLCNFLDKEIPPVSFPHKNKGGNIFDELIASHGIFQKLKQEAIYVTSIIGVVSAIAVGGILKWRGIL